MKTSMIVAATLAGAAGLASAQTTHTFDLSNQSFSGGFPSNWQITSMVADFGGEGWVTQVDWDVNYTSFSPSWLSELNIAIDTNDDLTFDADIVAGDWGAPNSAGSFAFSGSMAANTYTSDGLVFLTVWDSWADGVNPEISFGANSTVTITFVPAPGALAMLGLGGLVAGRRRR